MLKNFLLKEILREKNYAMGQNRCCRFSDPRKRDRIFLRFFNIRGLDLNSLHSQRQLTLELEFSWNKNIFYRKSPFFGRFFKSFRPFLYRKRPLEKNRRDRPPFRFWLTLQIRNQLQKIPSRFRGLSKNSKFSKSKNLDFSIFDKSNWLFW